MGQLLLSMWILRANNFGWRGGHGVEWAAGGRGRMPERVFLGAWAPAPNDTNLYKNWGNSNLPGVFR